MFDVSLFFGFPLELSLKNRLADVDADLLSLFINDTDPNYLRIVTYEGKEYLGKSIGKVINFADFPLIEANICSIIQRLIPQVVLKNPPVLFPLTNDLA